MTKNAYIRPNLAVFGLKILSTSLKIHIAENHLGTSLALVGHGRKWVIKAIIWQKMPIFGHVWAKNSNFYHIRKPLRHLVCFWKGMAINGPERQIFGPKLPKNAKKGNQLRWSWQPYRWPSQCGMKWISTEKQKGKCHNFFTVIKGRQVLRLTWKASGSGKLTRSREPFLKGGPDFPSVFFHISHLVE